MGDSTGHRRLSVEFKVIPSLILCLQMIVPRTLRPTYGIISSAPGDNCEKKREQVRFTATVDTASGLNQSSM